MNTSDLMQRIDTTVPAIPGWCELEKAHALAAAVLTLRPKLCVEIGVFGGRSLLPVAMACQAVGAGVIVGIDPWSAEAATEGYDGANAEWWGGKHPGSPNLEQIYQGFLRTVAELGVGAHVEVWRKKSDDVNPPGAIDLLSSDGQHTEQAVRDIKRFAPRIRMGGLCFVDDITWTNNGVAHVERSVDELIKLGFTELYKIGTGAVFQRVR